MEKDAMHMIYQNSKYTKKKLEQNVKFSDILNSGDENLKVNMGLK
jgi:hypothetical protein